MAHFWPEALGAATALLVALLYLTAEPSSDVAWQLWIGRQLRHGARFYVDVIETNPPLWFWMAIPIDWIAERIGTSPGAPLVAALGLASAASVVATGRLLGHLAASVRAPLLVYAALTLVLMPLLDMGQREQILLIVALPYVTLAAARYERRAPSVWLAIAIGLGSAFGFALKHYFLITPALIELWLLVGLGRRYRPFRPETIALGAMALIYAAAVLTLTPVYLTRIVPMLNLIYGATKVQTVSDMIHVPQYYWAMMAAILLVSGRLLARTPLVAAFAIAALGFGVAWFIQFKGWHYHEIAVTGFLMMALAALVAQRWHDLRPLVWMTAPALLAMPLAFAASAGPFRDVLVPVTRPMLTGLDPKDSIAFVSENEAYAWPLSLHRSSFYPSRHYGIWILHAIVQDAGRTPAITRLGRQVIDDTAQDYACAQPARIFFDQHDRGGFDLERYFLASPRFAALMTHYRRIGRHRQFDIFQRIAPFPAPPAGECRRGV